MVVVYVFGPMHIKESPWRTGWYPEELLAEHPRRNRLQAVLIGEALANSFLGQRSARWKGGTGAL